jgi:hypothetical protein
MAADSHSKPKPLPRWLQLRITASTLLSRSHRLGTGNVVVLPFKKIAKLDVSAGEIAAMEYVQANTTVPLPKSKLEAGYPAHSFVFFALIDVM